MINLDGFTLSEQSANLWVFEAVNGPSYKGSLRDVIVFAIKFYHFNIIEIEVAINDMIENDYTMLHFGTMCKYLYGSKPYSGRMAS